jgi:hypothetical protein
MKNLKRNSGRKEKRGIFRLSCRGKWKRNKKSRLRSKPWIIMKFTLIREELRS